MRRGSIRNLPFRHNLKPGLGFEIFRLSDLVARVPAAELASPQRPEFHIVVLGLRGRGSLRVDFTSVPIAPDALTVLARGRVQQLEVTRGVEAWLLLVSPEFIALDPRAVDPLRAASVLSTTWSMPSLRLSASDHRELVALCDQLAAEQARPLDTMQPAVLQALLRTVLLRAERLALAAADHPTPSAELQRFFTILDRDCTTTRSVAHYAKAVGVSARRLGELVLAHHLADRCGRSVPRDGAGRAAREEVSTAASADVIQRCS